MFVPRVEPKIGDQYYQLKPVIDGKVLNTTYLSLDAPDVVGDFVVVAPWEGSDDVRSVGGTFQDAEGISRAINSGQELMFVWWQVALRCEFSMPTLAGAKIFLSVDNLLPFGPSCSKVFVILIRDGRESALFSISNCDFVRTSFVIKSFYTSFRVIVAGFNYSK